MIKSVIAWIGLVGMVRPDDPHHVMLGRTIFALLMIVWIVYLIAMRSRCKR